jgi:hypothetical protein
MWKSRQLLVTGDKRPINRIDTSANVLWYFNVNCTCFPSNFSVAIYTSLAFTHIYHRHKYDIVQSVTLQSHTSFSLYFVKYTHYVQINYKPS